jgi:hypothetical protein
MSGAMGTGGGGGGMGGLMSMVGSFFLFEPEIFVGTRSDIRRFRSGFQVHVNTSSETFRITQTQ